MEIKGFAPDMRLMKYSTLTYSSDQAFNCSKSFKTSGVTDDVASCLSALLPRFLFGSGGVFPELLALKTNQEVAVLNLWKRRDVTHRLHMNISDQLYEQIRNVWLTIGEKFNEKRMLTKLSEFA